MQIGGTKQRITKIVASVATTHLGWQVQCLWYLRRPRANGSIRSDLNQNISVY
jgi:hypothetical protein